MSKTEFEFTTQFLDELPVIYEKGAPKAAVIDIRLLEALLERLDELEEKELLHAVVSLPTITICRGFGNPRRAT